MTTEAELQTQLLEKIEKFRRHLDELKTRVHTVEPEPSQDFLLNSLLENIPDSIFFKDTSSRFLLINKAYARVLGIAHPQDAHGKTDLDFFDAEIAQTTYDDEQYILKTGKPIINKRELISSHVYTNRWFSVTKVPLRDNTGKIFGIAGISRDISEEKFEEEALRTSEQRYKRLLTDTSDVISILDRKGIVRYESPSASRTFGDGERKPRLGTNIFGFCHPEDLKKVILTFTDLLQHPRESRTIVFRFRHANGSWIIIEAICQNLLDDPDINGIIVSSRDITDRKPVEEKTPMFEQVVKSANDAIVITDLQNNIIFVNQTFCEIYGYTSEEVIGKPVGIIWSGKNTDEKIEGVFSGADHAEWEGELYNRKKDGAEFPVYVSSSVIKDETCNPIAVAGIIRDISKQKKVQEQLRQSQKMESLSVLVGGIAHNFNNILGVIMGYASMLENPSIERDKLDRNVRVITEAAERGAHLVQQLMAYIKKSPIKFSDVAVNEVIGEMTEMVMQTFPQTITFSVDLDSREPVIHADKNQFRQVLFNLFLNARDAMPRGGTITVVSDVMRGSKLKEKFEKAKDVDYVQIDVNDSGVGMDEEIQSRIFDPFFTTKEVGQGVGLGLPMVYGIIDSHNGFVDVKSTLDEGSTFSVYIPLLRFENGTKPEIEEEIDEPISGEETILIVEDEESLRILLAERLMDSGYTVLQAGDGLEAIEIFEQHGKSLSAIILDIGLPKLGGYETFLHIRERNPNIPIIIASGYNDPDAKLAIETAGARLFVQKPYKFSHILKVVREVIESSRKRRN